MDIKSLRFKKMLDMAKAEGMVMDKPLEMELCKQKMCFGTPEDISKLLMAGYGSLFRKVIVVIQSGDHSTTVRMVQLLADENGCAMYQNGKCLLTDPRMVPLEGKLHLLSGGIESRMIKELVIMSIIADWASEESQRTVEYCLSKMNENKE